MLSATDRYPIPVQRFRAEIEVKRSRFMASVQEVCSAAEAQAFVAEIKAEFSDASRSATQAVILPPQEVPSPLLRQPGPAVHR